MTINKIIHGSKGCMFYDPWQQGSKESCVLNLVHQSHVLKLPNTETYETLGLLFKLSIPTLFPTLNKDWMEMINFRVWIGRLDFWTDIRVQKVLKCFFVNFKYTLPPSTKLQICLSPHHQCVLSLFKFNCLVPKECVVNQLFITNHASIWV